MTHVLLQEENFGYSMRHQKHAQIEREGWLETRRKQKARERDLRRNQSSQELELGLHPPEL